MRLPLAALAFLAFPISASAMKVKFDFSVHLSVCGRLMKDIDGDVCVGDAGLVSGTRQVEIVDHGCTGDGCGETKSYTGEHRESFSLQRPEVKMPYEVDLQVFPALFQFKDQPASYILEAHVSPRDGTAADDRYGFVSLDNPSALKNLQVSGVRRSMLSSDGHVVKVSPYVFISKLRFLPE